MRNEKLDNIIIGMCKTIVIGVIASIILMFLIVVNFSKQKEYKNNSDSLIIKEELIEEGCKLTKADAG